MATSSTRSQVSFKTAFTVCFAVVITAALVGFAYVTRFIIAVSMVALLLAVALDHVVSVLTRRGLKRGLAIGVVVVGFLAVLVGVGLLVIPSLVEQGKELANQAPGLLDRLKESRFLQTVEKNLGEPRAEGKAPPAQAPELVQGAAKPVMAAVGGALTVVTALVSILFLAIFLVIFGGDMVEKALAETLPSRREIYERVLEKTYHSLGGYILGLLFICTCNAVLTTTFLALTHTPFALALGILSGFSSLVPYAGPTVVGSAITLLALGTGGAWKALLTAGYFILYGQLEGQILGPLVWKRTVHINPLLTLVSVLFFGEFAGIIGAILAVPAAATLQIITRELLALRRQRLHLPPEPPEIAGGPSVKTEPLPAEAGGHPPSPH